MIMSPSTAINKAVVPGSIVNGSPWTRAEQKRLNVFAAANLYEVLELAIIMDRQGMGSSLFDLGHG